MLRVDMERETALDMLLRNSICAVALDMLTYVSEGEILKQRADAIIRGHASAVYEAPPR
jgi:hypothetical protein